MKRIALIAAIMGLGVAPAWAEKWTIIEGPKGETQGVWEIERQGDKLSGKGMAQTRGASASFELVGTLSGGKVSASRLRSSDMRSCNYIGEEKSDKEIVGSAICGGVAGVWRATRIR